MITVYRFAHELYSNDLSGKGASLYGGRWNTIGTPAVYTSLTISLALVELFIHQPTYNSIVHNKLLKIDIATNDVINIDVKKLKKNWRSDEDYCHFIGHQFFSYSSALALKVPSAIIEEECNIVLNPLAKNFDAVVKISQIKTFDFDKRLFK